MATAATATSVDKVKLKAGRLSGGPKNAHWEHYLTLGDGSLLPGAPKATTRPRTAPEGRARRGSTAARPMGTSLVIPNPGNPPAAIIADDVAVRSGGQPMATPTAASGVGTAVAAGGVVADTGPLAAGTYLVEINMGSGGVVAAGKELIAEHRNAANSGVIQTLALAPVASGLATRFFRIVVAASERIRVRASTTAFAAGENAGAQVRVYLLPI